VQAKVRELKRFHPNATISVDFFCLHPMPTDQFNISCDVACIYRFKVADFVARYPGAAENAIAAEKKHGKIDGNLSKRQPFKPNSSSKKKAKTTSK
jgi:hypothetical protein